MKDNCFNEFDPNALNVEDALSRILKSIVSKKDTELVPLKESYGRVLAKDIKSFITKGFVDIKISVIENLFLRNDFIDIFVLIVSILISLFL